MRFDLTPHTGASAIELGMTRKKIRSILGDPGSSSEKSVFEYGEVKIPVPAKDGYFENELQITFDDGGKADFIEFSGRAAKHTKVYLNGIDVFKIPAPQLLKKITESTNADFDKEEEEIPYSYVFKSIDLAVWRQIVPEIDEEKESVPDSHEGKYFWTIGIGIKGYYG
jgi:hypothetical protein